MAAVLPSVHFLHLLYPHIAGGGLLESYPAFKRREAGTPWMGRQPMAGLTQRQTSIHTHTDGQFRLIHSSNKDFCGRRPECPKKNSTYAHRSRDSNLEPSCCEAVHLARKVLIKAEQSSTWQKNINIYFYWFYAIRACTTKSSDSKN